MTARASASGVASFAAAAGSIGLAAFLTRACPGACTSCASCASSLIPMGTAAGAVGAALVGSVMVRSRLGREAAGGEKEARS